MPENYAQYISDCSIPQKETWKEIYDIKGQCQTKVLWHIKKN